MKGPSPHLSWNELACWNHTGRTWRRWAPGELVAPYPREWREDRAILLADTFEELRRLLGHVPIFINSAFRTTDYNAHVGGARGSQHAQGRALDIRHAVIPARDLCQGIRELQHQGALEHLGGLGGYPTFVHIDVRPKVRGRLAVWFG